MTETKCTPGSEFQCAVAQSYKCHCACGGKNHGKYPALRAMRNEHNLDATESRVMLRQAQQRAARAEQRAS